MGSSASSKLKEALSDPSNHKHAKKAFKAYDTNKDGILQSHEIESMINDLIGVLDIQDESDTYHDYVKDLAKKISDANGDGVVDFDEFIGFLNDFLDQWEELSVSHDTDEDNEKIEKEGSLYGVGVHKQDITGPIYGVGALGFANPEQKLAGLHQRLYCRSFVMRDKHSAVALIMTDLWSCTNALKLHVVRAVQASLGSDVFNIENVLISGIHTHAGPGGFSHYRAYNDSIGGFSKDHFDFLVDRISFSLIYAYKLSTKQVGYLSYGIGMVNDCGGNRSHQAFENNHPEHKALLDGFDTDRTMVVLRVSRKRTTGDIVPYGAIAWYGMHPTALGQNNTHCSSDSKGLASHLFEEEMKEYPNFIAAFPNASCGDVSSNVLRDHSFIVPEDLTFEENLLNVKEYGHKLFSAAKDFFDHTTPIHGPLHAIHVFRDMTNMTTSTGGKTAAGAFGVSFSAGSTQDGKTLPELRFLGDKEAISTAQPELLAERVLENSPWLVNMIESSHLEKITDEFKALHDPKPILLAFGLDSDPNDPWVPSVLPFQIVTLGNLSILSLPGEITSTAGMILKTEFKKIHPDREATICGLANGYSGYITTFQEYQLQYYEGASTMYGPHTHQAYLDIMLELAKGQVVDDCPPNDYTHLYDSPPSDAPKKLILELNKSEKERGNEHKEGGEHQVGSPVTVTFDATNPNNYFDQVDHYVTVKGRNSEHDEGVLITTDADPNVLITYDHKIFGKAPSTVEITWHVPPHFDVTYDEYIIYYQLGPDPSHYSRYTFTLTN